LCVKSARFESFDGELLQQQALFLEQADSISESSGEDRLLDKLKFGRKSFCKQWQNIFAKFTNSDKVKI